MGATSGGGGEELGSDCGWFSEGYDKTVPRTNTQGEERWARNWGGDLNTGKVDSVNVIS